MCGQVILSPACRTGFRQKSGVSPARRPGAREQREMWMFDRLAQNTPAMPSVKSVVERPGNADHVGFAKIADDPLLLVASIPLFAAAPGKLAARFAARRQQINLLGRQLIGRNCNGRQAIDFRNLYGPSQKAARRPARRGASTAGLICQPSAPAWAETRAVCIKSLRRIVAVAGRSRFRSAHRVCTSAAMAPERICTCQTAKTSPVVQLSGTLLTAWASRFQTPARAAHDAGQVELCRGN